MIKALNIITICKCDLCSDIFLSVGESVYYEPECYLSYPIESGCNAGGIENCKYCGFDGYQVCPSKSIIGKFRRNSDSFDDYVIDFDTNNNNIVLNVNETEYNGELKIDSSYNDGFIVSDLSSISNILYRLKSNEF